VKNLLHTQLYLSLKASQKHIIFTIPVVVVSNNLEFFVLGGPSPSSFCRRMTS